MLCALAVGLKFRFGFDDSLDVVGVHLVGGLVGTLLIGLFGTTEASSGGVDGLFYGGGFDQLGKQAVGAFAVLVYSFVVTTILALIMKYTIGCRLERRGRGQPASTRPSTPRPAYDFATPGGGHAACGLQPARFRDRGKEG